MAAAAWIAGALCAIALAECALFVSRVRHIRTLAALAVADPPVWPRVSVIMPARDEAAGIGGALGSRIADDYPDLELIVVDDRSTDGTGDVARSAADGDPRVRVLRVEDLPDGWLGKVHALHVGEQAATGEWLLFSDADVHVIPGALRRAVAIAEQDRLDMIALVPEYTASSWLVTVVWTVFLRSVGIMLSPKAIRNPNSKQALGSGAYNLVRRSAYSRTHGFEWLKLETADDIGLAMLVKRAGGSLEVMNGRGSASVEIYPTMRDFVLGVEKNGGTTAAHPWRFTFGIALFLMIDWSWLGSVGMGLASGLQWLTWLGFVTLAVMTIVHVAALRFNTGRIAPALLWPVGSALFAFGTLRATWLVHHRGGVLWRGTFHSLDEVNQARKFEF